MAAARRLFTDKGVGATSVGDIVQVAGVAQGTFYWYFESKDEVLKAVVEQITEEACARIEEISRSRDIGLMENVDLIRQVMFESGDDSGRGDLFAYLHTRGDQHFHDELARGVVKRLAPAIADMIKQGVKEGVLDVAEPDEVAVFVLYAWMGAHEDAAYDGEGSFARRIDAYWDFVLGGLGYKGPRRRR